MLTKIFQKSKNTKIVRKAFSTKVQPLTKENSIPKKIFIYWNSGFDEAPAVCQDCIASWKDKNPGWEVTILDQNKANSYIDIKKFDFDISQAAYSDILRAAILSSEGGVWVDSTLYCVAPLDSWLPQLSFNSGFFAFYRPGPDRVISSWFLASSKNNYLMDRLFYRCNKYLSSLKKAPENYFWFHYLFEYELIKNRQFKAIWDKTPKIPANLSHTAQRQYNRGETDEIELIKGSFVQKLSYKNGMDAQLFFGDKSESA